MKREYLITGFADEIADNLTAQMEELQKLDMHYVEMRGVDGKNLIYHSDDKLREIKERLDSAGISLSAEGASLADLYMSHGGDGVVSAVERQTGVRCSSYVMFDRASFISFATAYGNVSINVPRTLIIPDGAEAETINAGSTLFTSEMLFRYIMLADFEEGESYRFNMVGEILSEMINQNITATDSSLLDTYAGLIINAPDTNITAEKYNAHKAALLNTIRYAGSPAEYYVPYGEYNDNGGFIISDNSVTTIKQKAGVE